MRFFLLICILASLPLLIFSQIDTETRPFAKASYLEEAPIIDGDIMQDAVWQSIQPLSPMVQNQPTNGAIPSEKTEIRLAYTATTLFVSAVCYDAEPEGLVVTDARRDAALDNTDAFIFILDTYHDGQNGFVFGTNSMGVEYDGQVDNEGQGNRNTNRQQGGTIGGFNLNWDASWEVKSHVGDYGWSAEFAIPLNTIRFNSGENQTWGINFQRNIRKTNEIAFWAGLPLGLNLYRLSLAGDLTGMNVKSPGNLKVIPYALTRLERDFENVSQSDADFDAEVGVDVKYSITPNMTLDLTYNTDFAQVEVDDQQVNIDRFNLFFPEKRPFFLENAGLFSVGSPGEVDLFFSRRIGIGDKGAQVPIIGGARISGKINQTNIGAMSMFTDEISTNSTNINKNNYSIARVNHEFKGTRSALGGAFIGRYGMGEEMDDHNQTYALDGKLGLGKKARLSGFMAKTATPGITEGDHSYRLGWDYNWEGWRLGAAFTEVGEGFNPEVGFLQRQSFRKAEGLIFYNMRAKETSKFLENRPHIAYRSYWGLDGFHQTSWLHIDNHWVWKNGLEIHTGINFTREGVQADFQLPDDVIVPAGTYEHSEAQLVFFTNQSNPVSIYMYSKIGGYFGGERIQTLATLRFRFGDRFNSEFGIVNNDLNLPWGDVNTNVFRARLAYSFTPRIYLQSLIQHNSEAKLWSSNIRFGWLQAANTGLFVVYNENRGSEAIINRSFILKFTRMFDVLK